VCPGASLGAAKKSYQKKSPRKWGRNPQGGGGRETEKKKWVAKQKGGGTAEKNDTKPGEMKKKTNRGTGDAFSVRSDPAVEK